MPGELVFYTNPMSRGRIARLALSKSARPLPSPDREPSGSQVPKYLGTRRFALQIAEPLPDRKVCWHRQAAAVEAGSIIATIFG